MSGVDIEAIRARADAATPGPWHWYGNTATKFLSLNTWKSGLGRCNVMDFARWGMHGARPRFAVDDYMHDADEFAQWEVCHDAKTPGDPRLYRHDVDGIRHPDAEFIAHSRADVPALLASLDRVLALCDNVRAICERTGDAAEDYCHEDGCARYALDVEAIRAAINGITS